MPAGMTLQQLYSQGPYDPSSAAAGAAATDASPNKRNDKDATAHASYLVQDASGMPAYDHAQQQQQQQQLAMAQQHYAAQYGQIPPHHAYAADPLPFEYQAMRKFHEGSREQRFQPGLMPYGADAAYGQASNAAYDEHVAKMHGDDAARNAYAPAAYATDRVPTYHQATDMPTAYANPAQQGMPQHMYAPGPHNPMMAGAMPPNAASYLEAAAAAPALKKPMADAYAAQASGEFAPPPGPPQSATQEAVIKVKTPLKPKYWRNGRRNLQCFPSCKVYGDYSAIKIEDLKHHDFMWGKCRGSIVTEVTLNSTVAFDDILILGRVHSLENIPVAFEEAVIRECMLGRMVEPEAMDTMKDQWITGERLPDFVQQETNTSCFEFKPKVWKYTEDMTQGKCKRRNVKYYVQFEAFVLVKSGERRYYACIGSGMSTAFEVGSSRVLARQKRKAAASGAEFSMQDMKSSQAPSSGPANDMSSMQAMHQQMMAPGMMAPAPGMYAPPNAYAAYPPNRGMPAGYPQPGDMHAAAEAARYFQSAPASSSGMKRKMDSDVPSLKSDRPSKVLKAAVAM